MSLDEQDPATETEERTPASMLDQLDTREKRKISPDEFDDVWQTGVHARAALVERIIKKEREDAAAGVEPHNSDVEKLTDLDTGDFSHAQPSVAEKAGEWERQEKLESKPAPTAETVASREDWRVAGFGPDTPVGTPATPFDESSVPTSAFSTADEPDYARSSVRQWVAERLIRLARWFDPSA